MNFGGSIFGDPGVGSAVGMGTNVAVGKIVGISVGAIPAVELQADKTNMPRASKLWLIRTLFIFLSKARIT
jgi:hypothetical protein